MVPVRMSKHHALRARIEPLADDVAAADTEVAAMDWGRQQVPTAPTTYRGPARRGAPAHQEGDGAAIIFGFGQSRDPRIVFQSWPSPNRISQGPRITLASSTFE